MTSRKGLGSYGVMVMLGIGWILDPVPAHSAFNQQVTWSDMSDLDLKPVFRTDYASESNLLEPVIEPGAFEVALRDADSLINPEFHVPNALRPAVEFWLKIYTQYSTQNVVLFDSRHPEIVYDVLDFRSLQKTARNPVVYELTRKARMKKILRQYRDALHHLAVLQKRGDEPVSPTEVETKILEASKRCLHPPGFAEMVGHVRAQTGQRDNIIKGLLAAEAYFPKMEQLFLSVGVPVELTRLSLVESSFNLGANSRVGAAGVWQFMPRPGRKLMLIDYGIGIDERRSPIKSTVAAGRMLRENFNRFKSWPLAVTSYNHGLRGLSRFRNGRGGKGFDGIASLFDPCARHSPLGWAGRNYFAEFLAVVHAEAYRSLFYGVPPAQNVGALAYHRIEEPSSATSFANEHGIGLQDFKRFNPDVESLSKPLPRGFWVAMPGESDDFAGLMHPRQAARKARAVSLNKRKHKAEPDKA